MKKLELILSPEVVQATAHRLRGKVQALSLCSVQEWREDGPMVVYRGLTARSLLVPAVRMEAVCYDAALEELLRLLREVAPDREATVVTLEDTEEGVRNHG